MATLGQVIRRKRIDRGLTQEDLAKLVGSSKPTISRIENGGGSRKFTATLSKVCHELKIKNPLALKRKCYEGELEALMQLIVNNKDAFLKLLNDGVNSFEDYIYIRNAALDVVSRIQCSEVDFFVKHNKPILSPEKSSMLLNVGYDLEDPYILIEMPKYVTGGFVVSEIGYKLETGNMKKFARFNPFPVFVVSKTLFTVVNAIRNIMDYEKNTGKPLDGVAGVTNLLDYLNIKERCRGEIRKHIQYLDFGSPVIKNQDIWISIIEEVERLEREYNEGVNNGKKYLYL